MTDNYPRPDIGDRITYIDGDGEKHRAVVVSDCPDAEYVTAVTGGQGELGEDYNHSVESHSSVHPHESVYDSGVSTYAFTPGWD